MIKITVKEIENYYDKLTGNIDNITANPNLIKGWKKNEIKRKSF
jgi:hypothetical protein